VPEDVDDDESGVVAAAEVREEVRLLEVQMIVFDDECVGVHVSHVPPDRRVTPSAPTTLAGRNSLRFIECIRTVHRQRSASVAQSSSMQTQQRPRFR